MYKIKALDLMILGLWATTVYRVPSCKLNSIQTYSIQSRQFYIREYTYRHTVYRVPSFISESIHTDIQNTEFPVLYQKDE